MINFNVSQLVNQLVKEAQASKKPPEECSEKVVMKKDKEEKKEEVKKLAETLQYVYENFDSILPTTQLKQAEEHIKLTKVPRQKFDIKKDDMGHHPDDPSKPHKTVVNGNEHKTNVDNRIAAGKKQEGLQNKTAFSVLNKLAGEDTLKANIPASSYGSTEQKLMDSKKPVNNFAGNDKSGFGNELRPLVTSEQRAIDYTKRDAKRDYIKEHVGKLFSQVDPEKDTTVSQAFNKGTNTSKLAGLEVLKKMKKLVSEEENDEKTEEKVAPGIHKKVEKEQSATEKMAAILADKNNPLRQRLIKNIQKVAMEGAVPPTPVAGGNQAPQDPSMAGQMKPPGCTCMQGMDGQPLCPICNMKKLIAEAQMQQGGMQGAAPSPAPVAAQGGV